MSKRREEKSKKKDFQIRHGLLGRAELFLRDARLNIVATKLKKIFWHRETACERSIRHELCSALIYADVVVWIVEQQQTWPASTGKHHATRHGMAETYRTNM